MEKALRYNEGKLEWHLLYFPFIEGIIRVLEFGKKKYSEGNWMLHMDKNTILDSSMRHQVALMKGELIDPESGLPHIHHIACNQMFYDYHYGTNSLHHIQNGQDPHTKQMEIPLSGSEDNVSGEM